MATFDWSGSLPQTKGKIQSAQLRSRFGDLKTHINTMNPAGVVLPSTFTAGGALYGDGTTFAVTSAGTSGQLLQSNGASAPSWVNAFSQGSLAGLLISGRLTLESGVPISTSNQTAKTTVYFTPYKGDVISLYTGSNWELLAYSETSVAVPSTTNTNFDIFAYNNSGTLALETVDWTNDTTRATALTTQDGVYVKTGDATRRYIGTGRTTGSSGQTQTTTASWLLYNENNKVRITLSANKGTNTWSYGTATWRAAAADTTVGNTRVEVVFGNPSYVTGTVAVTAYYSSGTTVSSVGIAKSATNTTDSVFGTVSANGSGSPGEQAPISRYAAVTSAGYYYYQWVEKNNAVGSSTYNNQAGLAGTNGGLVVEVEA